MLRTVVCQRLRARAGRQVRCASSEREKPAADPADAAAEANAAADANNDPNAPALQPSIPQDAENFPHQSEEELKAGEAPDEEGEAELKLHTSLGKK